MPLDPHCAGRKAINRLLLAALCILLIGRPAVGATNPQLPPATTPSQLKGNYVEGITLCAQSYGGDEALRLSRDGVYIGNNSVGNCINLEQGNILLIPDRTMVIDTNLGKISIAPQAQLFLSKTENELVIYDLLQTKPGQITVTVNHKKIVLTPASMLVLTGEQSQDFEHLKINCHAVAYSNAKEMPFNGSQIKAFMANFSVVSAMTSIGPLVRLTQSNNRQDKLALDRLAKSIVISGESIDIAKAAKDSSNKEREVSSSL